MSWCDWLETVTLLTLIQWTSCAVIELGGKNYNVLFRISNTHADDRLRLVCPENENVTWYFNYLNDNTTYHSYPFPGCSQQNDKCSLEDSSSVLIVNQFNEQLEGNYICVDGKSAHGFTVSTIKCQPSDVKALPFNNRTASVGDNVTFTCEADVGCGNNVEFNVYKNGSEIPIQDIKAYERKYDGDNRIQGINFTITDVKRSDFNIEIECLIYDFDYPDPITQKAMILQKDIPTKIESVMDLKMILLVVIFAVLCLITLLLVCLYYPKINYHIIYKLCKRRSQMRGNKKFHGLILHNQMQDTYAKVEELKAALHNYRLKEYPPGPGSSDQQAGYSEPALLDNLIQQCACLIVFGDVGELEQRSLSSFEGKQTTHIILSKTESKKINSIYWPENWDERNCTGSKKRKWKMFIYQVRCRLPPLESGDIRRYDPEEEMLTSV